MLSFALCLHEDDHDSGIGHDLGVDLDFVWPRAKSLKQFQELFLGKIQNHKYKFTYEDLLREEIRSSIFLKAGKYCSQYLFAGKYCGKY